MATKELLNVRDTARTLGVHENTIRNWEERGILRAVRLPGSGYRRFSVQDVERLRTQMFEQLAPATEGPVVNTGRKRSGRPRLRRRNRIARASRPDRARR